MPIILRENAYRGVNAHLHSALQNEAGGWKVFHSAYLTHLAEVIDAHLPPGYEIGLTKSLQIVEDSATNDDDERDLTALFIHEINAEHEGKIVTWLELLSTSNKPLGQGFLQYSWKRGEYLLSQGVPLVEIDYLHETEPPIRHIPSYPDRQPNAHPYWIAVTDPRLSLEVGETRVYGFNVDEPIPTVDLPLAGSDILTFDFGPPYHQTFAGLSYFRNRADYEQEPPNFDSYTPADQQRIRARMAEVQE